MTPAQGFFHVCVRDVKNRVRSTTIEMKGRSDVLVSTVGNGDRPVWGCQLGSTKGGLVKVDKISADRPTVVGRGGVAGC